MNKTNWKILKNIGVTPDNLTVGGSLYLEGTGITYRLKVNRDVSFLSWQNGKYIMVDGEFAEVVSNRGNVWKVKHLKKDKVFYLVSDGNGKYSHGDTLKEAKDDLIFKISNRNKDEFNHLSIDSKLTFQEAIECYRVITGPCSIGVRNFIKSMGLKRKSYMVSDIISITKGEYGGNLFESFFNKNAK